MKILAFAASNSKFSINKQLVLYAAGLVNDSHVEILDLNDFELPLFSIDAELEIGHHKSAAKFLKKIAEADGLIVSFAEHNGSYTAAFKNLFDWCSRQTQKVWQGKPMVLLSTSPGPRGASTVLHTATESAPYFGGVVKASMSIPSFNENFDQNSHKLINDELLFKLKFAIDKLNK